MSAMVYAVVEFQSKSAATVEIVPIRWLNDEEDICKWPRCGSAEASRKVKKLVEADATWSEFPIRVLGKAATYERAREKLNRSLVTSDLNTDLEGTVDHGNGVPAVKRMRRPKQLSSSEPGSDVESEDDRSSPKSTISCLKRKSHRKLPARKNANVTVDREEALPPAAPDALFYGGFLNNSGQSSHTPATIVHRPTSRSSSFTELSVLEDLMVPQPNVTQEMEFPPTESSPLNESNSAGLVASTHMITPRPQPSHCSQTPDPMTEVVADNGGSIIVTPIAQSTSRTSDGGCQMSNVRATPRTTQAGQASKANTDRSLHDRQGNGLMLRILTVLEDLKETNRVQCSMLQAILRRVNEQHEQAELPSGIDLPLGTLDELHAFEEKAQEKGLCDAMVSVLGDLGGRTVKEVVRRVMKFVMRNDLAMQMNLCGRFGKTALGPTNLFTIIYRSVKRNAKTADCTKSEVENAVAEWLTGSRDRDGNRQKRQKRERQLRQID